MRVLLIEPDTDFARKLTAALSGAGLAVLAEPDPEAGHALAVRDAYDAILLRLAGPGLSVLRRLRRAEVATPAIALAPHVASVEARVEALQAGADDCLAAPWHVAELIARLHAVVRRAEGRAASEITLGNLTVCPEQRRVTVAGAAVRLTPMEFAMLALLAQRRHAFVSRDTLLTHMYADRDEPVSNALSVFIWSLRGKLRAAGCTARIVSQYGFGWWLTAEPESEAA